MSKVLSKYFNPEAIKLAYNRVKCWSDRTTKDQVGIRAFGHNIDENCNSFSNKILSGNYKPKRGFKFYVPKASKTLRTKTVLFIEDAIFYQAIVDKIAENNYSKLKEHEEFVFGSVLTSEVIKGVSILEENEPVFFFFKFWKNLFQKFKDSIIQSIEGDRVKYKFETDITGFFDCIPHYNLFSKLSTEFNVEDEILDMLSDCLNIWSGTKESMTPGVGIPQGVAPSFLLANLLLHKLDELLINQGYRYYRYMDDISIYGYNKKELLNALVLIDKYTKGNGLSINSKKTSIIEIDESEDSRVKELKKMQFFSLYDDEFEESSQSNINNELDKNSDKLSDQDGNFIFRTDHNVVETITDEKEIIKYWRSNITSVEYELPKLFKNPSADLKDLQICNNVDDLDFIRLSSQYGNSFSAILNLDEDVLPSDTLLKYWCFAFKEFFWRANIFSYTLMHYKNNEELKQWITGLFLTDFDNYEWVRYFIILNISLNQSFSDKELRQVYFKLLVDENSELVKVSLYRLLFRHSKNKQFTSAIRKELKNENNHYLKLLITDFNKNQDLGGVSIQEFIKAIGV